MLIFKPLIARLNSYFEPVCCMASGRLFHRLIPRYRGHFLTVVTLSNSTSNQILVEDHFYIVRIGLLSVYTSYRVVADFFSHSKLIYYISYRVQCSLNETFGQQHYISYNILFIMPSHIAYPA